MPKLVEFTKEEFDKLDWSDKIVARKRYAVWREKQRKQDRVTHKKLEQKIHNFKYRRKRKAYNKRWKKENKDKVRKYMKRYKTKKCIELHGHPPEIVKKIKDFYYINYYKPEVEERKRKFKRLYYHKNKHRKNDTLPK